MHASYQRQIKSCIPWSCFLYKTSKVWLNTRCFAGFHYTSDVFKHKNVRGIMLHRETAANLIFVQSVMSVQEFCNLLFFLPC